MRDSAEKGECLAWRYSEEQGLRIELLGNSSAVSSNAVSSNGLAKLSKVGQRHGHARICAVKQYRGEAWLRSGIDVKNDAMA